MDPSFSPLRPARSLLGTLGPLGIHAEVFACPTCRAPLVHTPRTSTCERCHQSFGTIDGIRDFSLAPGDEAETNVGRLAMQSVPLVDKYERVLRKNFVRIMGDAWDGSFDWEHEDAYLCEHAARRSGPVLDVACGAGRWTRILAQKLGDEHLIGLDLSMPMLRLGRARMPEVCLVRGDALHLPFRDACLGGANCWNALTLLPQPNVVLAEIARCLEPRAVLTCFTFETAEDPIYRHFQQVYGTNLGNRTFTRGEIEGWLGAANMSIIDFRRVHLNLLFTARKN